MTADSLRAFISNKMQMQQIYQPVMLNKLLSEGGKASEREIAKEILKHDESQIEYFQHIVQNMVGRILRKHSLVRPHVSHALRWGEPVIRPRDRIR